MDSAITLDRFVRNESSSPDQPRGYSEALQSLEELQSQPGLVGSLEFADACGALLTAIDLDLVIPLLELAEKSQDPLRRNLIVFAAQLAREFHRGLVPNVSAAGLRGRQYARPQCGTTGEQLSKLFQISRAFLEIYRDA
jgi:hypothetical protein